MTFSTSSMSLLIAQESPRHFPRACAWFVNLRLRADINAARWFVENQNFWPHREPFCRDDFLLVAAAEIAEQCFDRGCFDPEYFSLLLRYACFSAALDQAAPRIPRQIRQRNVFPNRHADNEPLTTSVFRHEINAISDRIPRRADGKD